MKIGLIATLSLMSSQIVVSQAFAAETSAAVVYIQGTVKIVKSNGQETMAQLGSAVAESDSLVTEDASQVRVRLYDRSLVRLGANSRAQMSKLNFDASGEKKSVSVKLVIGRLWASVSKLVSSDSIFEVQTNAAVAGVRGTEFAVLLGRDNSVAVTTAEGSVNVRATDGSERLITAGFEATLGASGFRDVRQVSAETITALRDESRGNGAVAASHEPSGGAVEARLERAMEHARSRFDNANDRVSGDSQRAEKTDRDHVRIGGEQGVIENRQRGRDVFEQVNARAGATHLKVNVDIKE